MTEQPTEPHENPQSEPTDIKPNYIGVRDDCVEAGYRAIAFLKQKSTTKKLFDTSSPHYPAAVQAARLMIEIGMPVTAICRALDINRDQYKNLTRAIIREHGVLQRSFAPNHIRMLVIQQLTEIQADADVVFQEAMKKQKEKLVTKVVSDAGEKTTSRSKPIRMALADANSALKVKIEACQAIAAIAKQMDKVAPNQTTEEECSNDQYKALIKTSGEPDAK